MLRPSFLAAIRKVLDNTKFSALDFSVNSSSEDGEPILSVVFLHDDRFIFNVHEIKGGYKVVVSPGDTRMVEYFGLTSLEGISDDISSWSYRVYEEVKQFSPLAKEFEVFKAGLQDYVDSTIEDSLARFTASEINNMTGKLAELEARLAKMQSDAEITKQQYDKAVADLEKIVSSMQDLPKSVWYKTAGNRIWFLLQSFVTSKEGQKTISSAVQKAIGIEGP